jgi:hypothetical protein
VLLVVLGVEILVPVPLGLEEQAEQAQRLRYPAFLALKETTLNQVGPVVAKVAVSYGEAAVLALLVLAGVAVVVAVRSFVALVSQVVGVVAKGNLP